jgi:hypothetical protein
MYACMYVRTPIYEFTIPNKFMYYTVILFNIFYLVLWFIIHLKLNGLRTPGLNTANIILAYIFLYCIPNLY